VRFDVHPLQRRFRRALPGRCIGVSLNVCTGKSEWLECFEVPQPFTHRGRTTAMLVFLDTEFTQIQQPDLISVGLVSELGHEFYAELADFPRDRCSEFVGAEVLPLFGRVAGALCGKSELARRLREWFDSLGESVIVIFDYEVDWELLDLAFRFDGGTAPTSIEAPLCLSGLIVTDPMYQEAFKRSLSEAWPRHHALADARAIHAGYRAWRLANAEALHGV